MKTLSLLLVTLLIFSGSTFEAFSQIKWVEKAEHAHYTEGVYALDVSTSLELISLTGHFESYEFGKGQQLFAAFYAPTESPFYLRAQEKKILSFYAMESRNGTMKKGKNQFGPWQVDGFLESKKVAASNLGVLLQMGLEPNNHFLPLVIHHSSAASPFSEYKAVFRLGKSIAEGAYKVYKGEHMGIIPEEYLVYGPGRIGRLYGGSNFNVKIPVTSLQDYEGWLTVEMSLSLRGINKKIPFRFYVYHYPPQKTYND